MLLWAVYVCFILSAVQTSTREHPPWANLFWIVHCLLISIVLVPTTNCTQPQGSRCYFQHSFNPKHRKWSESDHGGHKLIDFGAFIGPLHLTLWSVGLPTYITWTPTQIMKTEPAIPIMQIHKRMCNVNARLLHLTGCSIGGAWLEY
jgi:hypothetical protein